MRPRRSPCWSPWQVWMSILRQGRGWTTAQGSVLTTPMPTRRLRRDPCCRGDHRTATLPRRADKRRETRGQCSHAAAPTFVGIRTNLSTRQRPQIVRQRFRIESAYAADKHRNHRDVSREQLADLRPDPVVRISEASMSRGIGRRQPVRPETTTPTFALDSADASTVSKTAPSGMLSTSWKTRSSNFARKWSRSRPA